MTASDRQAHWQNVYLTKGEQQVSWTQPSPEPSLSLIEKFAGGLHASIIDVGGGASQLVDALRQRGYEAITVLDVSQAALDAAKQRLGPDAADVQWIAADITRWQPRVAFDVWHDRAAFHFLVEDSDRAAYIARLSQALKPGGYAIIATFAADGPEKCSGLPVHRTDADGLAKELGEGFALVDSLRHDHATPGNSSQRFQFSVFQRRGGA
jgi:trans-aconitate methyltransferase